MKNGRSMVRKFVGIWALVAALAGVVLVYSAAHHDGGIILLDGGTGSEIRARGLPFNEVDWSAKILMEDRLQDLTKIHQDYINSGADVVTINTYGISLPIGKEKLLKDGPVLVQRAIKAAVDARNVTLRRHGGRVRLAGSVPPMFGSYRPDLFNPKTADRFYKIVILPLVESDEVDLLLAETVSSFQEMEFLVRSFNETMRATGKKKPYWISFTLNDDAPMLRSGEDVRWIGRMLLAARSAGYELPEAILFNCSQPEVITEALGVLKKEKLGLMLGGYANRFVKSQVDGEKETPLRNLSEDEYLDFANQWHAAGAHIIGGCCGVGPSYISRISKAYKVRRLSSLFSLKSLRKAEAVSPSGAASGASGASHDPQAHRANHHSHHANHAHHHHHVHYHHPA